MLESPKSFESFLFEFFPLVLGLQQLIYARINIQRSNYLDYNKPNNPRLTQDPNTQIKVFSTIILKSNPFLIDNKPGE